MGRALSSLILRRVQRSRPKGTPPYRAFLKRCAPRLPTSTLEFRVWCSGLQSIAQLMWELLRMVTPEPASLLKGKASHLSLNDGGLCSESCLNKLSLGKMIVYLQLRLKHRWLQQAAILCCPVTSLTVVHQSWMSERADCPESLGSSKHILDFVQWWEVEGMWECWLDNVTV